MLEFYFSILYHMEIFRITYFSYGQFSETVKNNKIFYVLNIIIISYYRVLNRNCFVCVLQPLSL